VSTMPTAISYADFQKIVLKIGRILEAQKIPNSEKLVLLRVDLGTETRQLVAGIAKKYNPAELVNREIVVLVNLEPKKLMGVESRGMLLAACDEKGDPVLLMPDKEVPPGSPIR